MPFKSPGVGRGLHRVACALRGCICGVGQRCRCLIHFFARCICQRRRRIGHLRRDGRRGVRGHGGVVWHIRQRRIQRRRRGDWWCKWRGQWCQGCSHCSGRLGRCQVVLMVYHQIQRNREDNKDCKKSAGQPGQHVTCLGTKGSRTTTAAKRAGEPTAFSLLNQDQRQSATAQPAPATLRMCSKENP